MTYKGMLYYMTSTLFQPPPSLPSLPPRRVLIPPSSLHLIFSRADSTLSLFLSLLPLSYEQFLLLGPFETPNGYDPE